MFLICSISNGIWYQQVILHVSAKIFNKFRKKNAAGLSVEFIADNISEIAQKFLNDGISQAVIFLSSNNSIILDFDNIIKFSTVKTLALTRESDKNKQATIQLIERVIQEDFIQVLQPKSLVNIRDNNIQIVDEITQVAKINPDEWAFLHDAAEISDTEGVNALIKEKDTNSRDRYGRTSLHYAASKGHIEILRSLLDSGAKFDEKDNVGMIPLCLAIVNDYQEIVETPVEKGANVNVVSKSGKTPLDRLSISRHALDDLCSSRCRHIEIEGILLKNGAVQGHVISSNDEYEQDDQLNLSSSMNSISGNQSNPTSSQSSNPKGDEEGSETTLKNQSSFGNGGSNSSPYFSEDRSLLKVSASNNKQGVELEVLLSESESEDDKTVILADTKKKKQAPTQPAEQADSITRESTQSKPATNKQDISAKDNSNSNSKSKSKENNVTSQNKKMYILVTSALVVAGIVSGIAIAVYSGMLAVGIAVGICCLVAAAVIYCCNKPSNSLENSSVEAAGMLRGKQC